MAVAARKYSDPRSVKPHLRVVKARPVSRARSADVARRNFTMFAVAVAIFSAIGIARVWVSVQAIESAFEASRLKADIKSERYEGDMLEVRESALGSPSRIRAIAGSAMDMAPAPQVGYIDVTGSAVGSASTEDAGQGADQTLATTASTFGKALAAFLELTAGEAEALLVGDVGFASTR